MRISLSALYALIATIEVAKAADSRLLTAPQFSAAFPELPKYYLVPLLKQLEVAGIVFSVRGCRGGYRLARPASQISLRDVIEAINGPAVVDAERLIASLDKKSSQLVTEILNEIVQKSRMRLNTVTMQDLLAAHVETPGNALNSRSSD